MNKKILKHFKISDPILHPHIVKLGASEELKPARASAYFFRLCREIAYQQLAGSAARAIFGRFEGLFPKKRVEASYVLEISHETLRGVGLSNAKARYIKNLAENVASGKLDFKHFYELADEEVIQKLIQVKGIGRWTAEMFLMFTLGREDVFSHGDLGLKKAMKKIYKFRKDPLRQRVESIVNRWSPYKTYGCMALWQSVDI